MFFAKLTESKCNESKWFELNDSKLYNAHLRFSLYVGFYLS